VLAPLAIKNIQIWHVSKAYVPNKLHFTATVRTSRSYCLKLSHHQKNLCVRALGKASRRT